MFEHFKNLLERRRVIKRHAPRGFFIPLFYHTVASLGVLLCIPAFVMGVPYTGLIALFLLVGFVFNTMWYTSLWYEMIASVRRNEPEKLDLVLKYG